MLLQVGNIWTNVKATQDEEVRLWNLLVFESPRARFTTAFQSGAWDGKVRLYHIGLHRFPTGLWCWLQDNLRQHFPDMTVQDVRQKPEVTFVSGNGRPDLPIFLRDYQHQAVNLVLEKERGVIWLPTGSGKTEIAYAVSQRITGRKLFLVHRKDLLQQTWERFSKYGAEVGRLGAGYRETDKEIVVSTIQTFSKLGDKSVYKNWAAVFFDECHGLPADVFYKTAMKIDAYYRVGLSGTPLGRSDERSVFLICATGPVLIRIKPEVLAKEGFLVLPKVLFHRISSISTCHSKLLTNKQSFGGTKGFWDEYLRNIVYNSVRNQKVVSLAMQSQKPCLVFVRLIEHGRLLRDLFKTQANLVVPFIWGGSIQEVRNQFRRAMVKGKLDILIASTIFEEGIDIPNLHTIIVASGGKSGIKTIQRIGRGMRPDTDKYEVVVHDFVDIGKWTQRHSRDRRKLYLNEGYKVEDV